MHTNSNILMITSALIATLVFLISSNPTTSVVVPQSPLRIGHYRSTCPQAETIVRQVVERMFAADPSITAALLRIHFHDCFSKGCDASLLIDPTAHNPNPQKTAPPNKTVRGFNVIDAVKAALELACPKTVSCSDTIALATRDAVSLSSSGGLKYAVPTGRLDGVVSRAADVKLPAPSLSVYLAFTQFFQPLGFTLPEMVVLLGAHTVGSTHCSLFQDRLVNFMGTGRPDPSMDPALVRKLMVTCGRGGGNATAALDQGTSLSFDGSYYREVKQKRGVLAIDQELGTNPVTSGMVSRMGREEFGFRRSFGAAMVKLGRLAGSGSGEIRKTCWVINGPNS
ncbi:Peroxidase 57 [Linum grandiflorum]